MVSADRVTTDSLISGTERVKFLESKFMNLFLKDTVAKMPVYLTNIISNRDKIKTNA